jgi:hypothetical protein
LEESELVAEAEEEEVELEPAGDVVLVLTACKD